MDKQTITIGIAGGSGCGKSTLCATLEKRLGQKLRFKVISTDAFFVNPLPKMISPVNGKEYDDWNSPKSVNHIEIEQAIMDAQREYDVVLVEGLSALYFEELRNLFNLKIFIELDSDERMYRRIKRNMAMWNMSMEEVADYYLNSAKFSEQKNYLDTKMFADIVLNGRSNHALGIDLICAWLLSIAQ